MFNHFKMLFITQSKLVKVDKPQYKAKQAVNETIFNRSLDWFSKQIGNSALFQDQTDTSEKMGILNFHIRRGRLIYAIPDEKGTLSHWRHFII